MKKILVLLMLLAAVALMPAAAAAGPSVSSRDISRFTDAEDAARKEASDYSATPNGVA